MNESMKLNNFKQSNTLVVLYVDNDGLKNKIDLNNCIFSVTKQQKKVDLLVFHNDLTEDEVKTLESVIASPELTLIKKDEKGEENIEKMKIEKGEGVNYKIINTKSKTFPQFFNEGFNYALENEYEFYCITEQEDSFAVHWFKYADTYAKEEENIDIFLPIIRHTVDNVFVGTINEASWVEGMAEEAGITDINLLLRFNSVNILGSVFRVDAIKESSEEKENGFTYPIKESIRISHSYEFFLRMVYDDLKVRTVPRIGYELKVINKNKFNEISSKIPKNLTQIPSDLGGIPQKEIQYYIDSSKKEYFFEEDREKIFEE